MCDKHNKCNNIFKQNNNKNEAEQIGKLKPDLSKNNCSIIIKDIEEDEKEYKVKIKGKKGENVSTIKIRIQGNPYLSVEFKSILIAFFSDYILFQFLRLSCTFLMSCDFILSANDHIACDFLNKIVHMVML